MKKSIFELILRETSAPYDFSHSYLYAYYRYGELVIDSAWISVVMLMRTAPSLVMWSKGRQN